MAILGSGAGFALEDVYALTQSVAWAYRHNLKLRDGLRLFDAVRGPYYKQLVSDRCDLVVTLSLKADLTL
jgi:2-polyprenyl-6-methoxyphenol hydroxylase-like FAD-dependent oxidoreductase